MDAFALRQSQTLSQVQVLSQRQIQSLELLSLGSGELREAVYKAAAENPALEITRDDKESGLDVPRRRPPDGTRITTRTTQSAEQAGDRFQQVLEAQQDMRQPLQEHLLQQLHMQDVPPGVQPLAERLIYNLDGRGFHLLAPESLLDRTNAAETPELLASCLRLVQGFDPPGTCTASPWESLLVQARQREDAPPLALFILDGHADFLDPPVAARVAKKIAAFQAGQKKLFGVSPDVAALLQTKVTEAQAQAAIDFVRSLDPYPARNFGTAPVQFVAPDAVVQEIPVEDGALAGNGAPSIDFARGTVQAGGHAWSIRLAKDAVPQLSLHKDFADFAAARTPGGTKSAPPAPDARMVAENVQKAQDFLAALALRQDTIVRALCVIVARQHAFFAKGPGNLVPLLQQDVARELSLHESTVSRMANAKFVRCAWGLFPLQYFFAHAAAPAHTPHPAEGAGAPAAVSKDAVLHAIQEILGEQERAGEGKKLSDQNVCDLLAERGIRIARRTVAKYRAQLQIASSYDRE